MAFSVFGLITTVIGILVSALILMVVARMFKLSDKSYKTALFVAGIAGIANYVLQLIGLKGTLMTSLSIVGVGIAMTLWLIKYKYSLDWGKSALVWLVYFLIGIAVGWITVVVIGIIAGTLGIAPMMAQGAAMMGGAAP